jgi:hypothetical protein
MWLEYRVHPDIAGEIKANDHERHLHGCDPLDEHRDLVRVKVAGTLAVLDDRDDISPDDWTLAGRSSTCPTPPEDGCSPASPKKPNA